MPERFKTEKPKTQHFYLKPKVYKEGNPGRPVISSINFSTSEISEHVDYHLNQLLKKSHHTSKIQPTFLGRLTKFSLF